MDTTSHGTRLELEPQTGGGGRPALSQLIKPPLVLG